MKLNKLLLALAASGIATSAFATNGYFAHGIGVKAKAMGGASIAFAEDGFGLAANPANLALIDAGYSLGVSAFSPDRASTMSGSNGLTGLKEGNRVSAFAIPEFAYISKGKSAIEYGVVVYGNGGMNADYNADIYDDAGRKTFTNLEQLFIAPTLAMKLNDNNTIAASLNLVYQTIELGGLGDFKAYTQAASNINGSGGVDPANHGTDSSTGVGVKLGWNGRINDIVTAGAFYQPETSMKKFDKYKNLLAQNGGFNIPTTYGVGVAIKAAPKTTVAMDVVQINYGDIKSLANKNDHNFASTTTDLGQENGKGFGWKDMTVYKLGVAHQVDANTIIRAGWNYGKQPIPTTELDFNLLAPAVVEHHLTGGFTRQLDKDTSFSMHAMYAPKVSVSSTDTTAGDSNGTAYVSKLQMSQYEIGFQYSKKF